MSADPRSVADAFYGAFARREGAAMAALAKLVICNGGSPAIHQALLQGTPVIGIPANLDQLLNMRFVVRSGAGLSLRADRVAPQRFGRTADRALRDSSFREHAQQVRTWFERYRVERRFVLAIACSGQSR